MAELTLTIEGNIKKLQEQVKKFLRGRHEMNVEVAGGGSGGGAGGKEQKKQTNRLGVIAGTLAAILSILAAAKPLLDFIKIVLSLVVFWIIKLWKNVRAGADKVTAFVKQAIDWIKKLPENIGPWIEQLGTWLSTKLQELKDAAIQKLKDLRQALIDRVLALRDKIVAALLGLRDRIGEKLSMIRDAFIERIGVVREKIAELIKGMRERLQALGERISTKFESLKSTIRTWLDKVRSAITGLAGKIASKIRGAIRSGLKIRERASEVVSGLFSRDKVNDAVIQNGRIIRTDPRDTIIATQGGRGGGGGNVANITINASGDTREIVEAVRQALSAERYRASRF